MDSGNQSRGRRGSGKPAPSDAPFVPAGESLLTKRKLENLAGSIQQQPANRAANGNVDRITLSPEVAEVLCELATDFVENAAAFGCRLAKHRKSKVLEVRDLQAYLGRHWDITIPGFGTSDDRLSKNRPTDEHRQKVVSVEKAKAQAAQGEK